jgi:hypothetical protein
MQPLESRVARLERQNRLLIAALLLISALFLLGLKRQTQDTIQAQKLQIVDQRGVPLVTLDANRAGGGEVILRDVNGDQRAWFSAEKKAARVGLIGGDNDSSVGLSADAERSRIAVIGGRAFVAQSIQGGKPSIEADGQDGQVLFQAPFAKGL